MKLSQCKINTIVTNIKESYNYDCSIKYKPNTRIGYIKGLTMNSSRETIPIVIWSDEVNIEAPCHYGNIKPYKEKV